MKLNSKSLAVALTMALGMLFSTNAVAQSSCCGGEKHDEATCTTEHKKDAKVSCGTATTAKTTSGCLPSSCRGAKTKFGEAKVISNLRSELVSLKAKMEKSTTPKFDARSYDIHGIVGETDDESLQIMVREVKLVEKEFSNKTKFKALAFVLPENKAKQIKYLESRVEGLKKLL
ncbi:hypothetical protein A9Q86_15395 [Flavobacteriales bacterium 33_180_T64]|nr:hypothetical protein A9Q86_15395 [Flavobacteriales bacterium 33_180_T64]